MKKILLLSVFALGFSANSAAQVVLFEDSFETYTDFEITNVGNWTLTDVDMKATYGFNGITFPNGGGVAKSFQVFNATATTPPITPTATSDWTARTGSKHMVCFASGANPAPPALNDDWLISPQITLGTTGNTLSFWAKSCDGDYGAERFTVGVSNTTTATSSFTALFPGLTITDPAMTWTQYTYNLDTYAGQPVYISINCTSNDQFGFAVDDFKVTATSVASTESFFKNNFTVYPNPADNFLNVNVKNGVTVNEVALTDLNGRIVKTISSSFDSNLEINVSDLSAGVYMLTIKTNEGVGNSKFVKK